MLPVIYRALVILPCIPLLIIIMSFVAGSQDKVLQSLGRYEKKEFYTAGWRDYTDYAVYRYSAVDMTKNPYITTLDAESQEALNDYLENFQSSVDAVLFSDPKHGSASITPSTTAS